MKKEKRKFTLEQLERKERLEKKIPIIILVLSFITFIIGIIMAIIVKKFFENDVNINVILSIYIYIELFLCVLLIINYKISENTKNQIILVKESVKVKALKKLAEEHSGHIKSFVSLKDEKVITDILSNNIVRITIDFIQDKNFVTTIQYADDTHRSGIRIPAKEFVSILDENSKKIMLNDSIKNIILGDSVGEIKEIVITGTTYIYKEDISDDELLEMFGLKE